MATIFLESVMTLASVYQNNEIILYLTENIQTIIFMKHKKNYFNQLIPEKIIIVPGLPVGRYHFTVHILYDRVRYCAQGVFYVI